MEQQAAYFAGLMRAYPLTTLMVAFVIVCILARLCMNLMYQPRNMDDDLLSIEDFYMHGKDPGND